MTIRVKVDRLARRIAVILGAVLACGLLSLASVRILISGVLSDPRADVRRELLAAGIAYVPNSAAVNARLAQAEMVESDRDLAETASLAQRAVNISPWDYRNWLLLASVKEAAGDRPGAETCLQEALNLAPNYTDVHWRFANLLLRDGKLARSVTEFQTSIASDSRLLPSTLDLLWRVSGGNTSVVRAVTPKDPKSRVSLAQFLLKQSRIADAITIFAGIDRASLLASPESSSFVDGLIAAGKVDEARGLWIGLVSGTYAQPGQPLPAIWNGSFESEISTNLGQFDWMISRNEYASPTIDGNASRTGQRSLRIDFTGRDTTRLDGQVKQTIQVRPGAHYSLECFAKTERLETPEAPRVAVTDVNSGAEISTSSPVGTGSSDWHRIEFQFTAPLNARSVVLTIKRVPRYSYDEPTRGTVWFDDFVLNEQAK